MKFRAIRPTGTGTSFIDTYDVEGFSEVGREELTDLLIHELAHHWVSDHLSSDYYDKLTELGAASTELALEEPELFDFR